MAVTIVHYLDILGPVLRLLSGQGFLVSRHQSSVLAMELPGAELTCSDVRPKSWDEKWGLGVPNREESVRREEKISSPTMLYLAPGTN